MNSSILNTQNIQKQAKIVGFTYLVTTLIGFTNIFFVKAGIHKLDILLE